MAVLCLTPNNLRNVCVHRWWRAYKTRVFLFNKNFGITAMTKTTPPPHLLPARNVIEFLLAGLTWPWVSTIQQLQSYMVKWMTWNYNLSISVLTIKRISSSSLSSNSFVLANCYCLLLLLPPLLGISHSYNMLRTMTTT